MEAFVGSSSLSTPPLFFSFTSAIQLVEPGALPRGGLPSVGTAYAAITISGSAVLSLSVFGGGDFADLVKSEVFCDALSVIIRVQFPCCWKTIRS